jgi:hypothetical protein
MNGELEPGVPHPCALDAVRWIHENLSAVDLLQWREAFASSALAGSVIGDVCGETLDRFLDNKPVSDRYVLGLAWMLRECHVPNASEKDHSQEESQ